MTRRKTRDDLAALLSAIHSEDADEFELVTSASINRQTVQRMAALTSRIHDQLSARFVGGSADAHRLSVRASARAVSSIQETVSAIGANLLGHVSAKGKLPDAVIRATELHLSPAPGFGSIVFELHRSDPGVLVEGIEDSVLDDSFRMFFEVIEEASRNSQALDATPAAMKSIGPRAARHIFQLCEVLVSEGMGVDFDWANSVGKSEKVRLTRSAARYLKGVAKNSNKREENKRISGTLETVTTNTKKPIEILSEQDGVVKISATQEARESLGKLYNQRVIAEVRVTETVSVATGVVSEDCELLSISLESSD